MIVTFGQPNAVIEASPDNPEQESQRTIRGVAVPWNQVGMVSSGEKVKFLPGALDASERPIVVVGHDTARPIGRIVEATDSEGGLETVTRVSRVRDGDDTLTLAADGVLGMFSVGVDPTEFHYEDDVLVIAKAEWHHLGLLPFGAFRDAVVTNVAASQGENSMPDLTTDAPATTLADPAPPAVAASPAVIPLVTAGPPPPSLDLRRVATIIAEANQKGMTADAVRATLTAALADITAVPGGAGVVPHAYSAEIRGLITRARATIDAISSAPLPASGMKIDYPSWKVMPDVALQATDKTAIHSAAAEIEMLNASVLTWAGGNDISLQLVERSSPSFMEAYLRAMAASYARQTNAYVVNQLLAAAHVVAPPATFLGSIAALLGSLNPATTPPGQVFVGMSWDVGAVMFGVKSSDGPAFWSGSISLAGGDASLTGAGLNLYVDWDMPAKTMIAGTKPAATWYEDPSSPADVRVVDVSLLGVDVGVYGFGALTVNNPQAFGKITYTTLPADLGAETASSGTSKKG